MRQRYKGICHPPSVVWHALVRWAHGQGIPLGGHVYDEWRGGVAGGWPDGWLVGVPALAERRGSAPATVSALKSGTQGRRDRPATQSMGSHGLIRTLPVSVVGMPSPRTFELAADVAALTHGHPSGFITAADGALLATTLLTGRGLQAGVDEAERLIAEVNPGSDHVGAYARAADEGRISPGEPGLLAQHAYDRTAFAALRGALYVAGSFPRPEQVLGALTFAARGPGSGVAAVAGALLGAVHGLDALPPALVSRLELAWAADTLARDLVSEIVDSPGGQETWTESASGTFVQGWQDGADPAWHRRYPGW
ncbi:MAG: ADP-ribosylglycohydrolase family protein [Actinomycetota bacterium]|nr:ADP-ribosylglycohydrolase family protein [Actinomycetota bacterium]